MPPARRAGKATGLKASSGARSEDFAEACGESGHAETPINMIAAKPRPVQRNRKLLLEKSS
jgi:hypothetical protein